MSDTPMTYSNPGKVIEVSDRGARVLDLKTRKLVQTRSWDWSRRPRRDHPKPGMSCRVVYNRLGDYLMLSFPEDNEPSMLPETIGEKRLPGNDAPVDGPVVFLAGPIQGAGPWHDAAERLIRADSKLAHVTIASPCSPRWADHAAERSTPEERAFDYGAQVDWESRWLNRAAEYGVILFWMAREQTHHPERAYAQTTRFEFAEWWTRGVVQKKAHLVAGIETGYSGERYIRHRAQRDTPDFRIYHSLGDTIHALAQTVENVWPA